jgi:hypothetical protein
MHRDDIDWRSGRVRYWYLDFLDLTRSFKSHDWIDLENEDLARVEYPHGIVLDIGWYGGKQRNFRVKVVWPDTPDGWWKPRFNSGCRTTKEVVPLINRAIVFIESRIVSKPNHR